MMNMFLAAESDELQRCMRLFIETENVRPIKFLSYEKEKNSLQTEYVVGDSFLINYGMRRLFELVLWECY